MVKNTFMQKFEKSTKFYDHIYHLHKSTFKGLSEFYTLYSKTEKQYSQQLIRLSKNIWSDIPDLRKQNSTLRSTVKQVLSCLQATSQLHFNYGEKLQEISAFYSSEYLASKKKKESHMKIIRQRNEEEYSKVRQKQKNNKEAITAKEKDICRKLHDGLEKLADEENQRIQKVKEQSIIYFSVYRKVCEKQLQRVSEQNQKLIKQEFQVRNKSIEEIADELRIQHNQYPGQTLERKSYDLNKTMIFNRDSLKNSLMKKKRVSKITDHKTKIKDKVNIYEQIRQELTFVCMVDTNYAIFDDSVFTDSQERRKYSREIKGEYIRAIIFQMFENYVRSHETNSDSLVLMQMVKAKLNVKNSATSESPCNSIEKYFASTSHRDYEYRWHLKFLQILSEFYQNQCPKKELHQHAKKRHQQADFTIKPNESLGLMLSFYLMNILVDTIFSRQAKQAYLSDQYVDFLLIFSKFGELFLNIDRKLVVLSFLKKFMKLSIRIPRGYSEPLQDILHDKYLFAKSKIKYHEENMINISQWTNNLLNQTTQQLLYFFESKNPFINHIKTFLIIERLQIRKEHNFNAKEHIYIAMRGAGYNYLKTIEMSQQILDTNTNSPFQGEQRLKILTEVFQSLEYETFVEEYFLDASKEAAILFGVSQKLVRSKFLQQFTYAVLQIADENLSMIGQEEGIDRQGYALRLGVIFAKLDIMNPVPIVQYDSYFQVLQKYLDATEKDYDNMLQQSRRTQLWIMEENALATTNCIDFCSLLYKPFEFLLISLNKLEDAEQTDYTKKFTEFIKLRLNRDLKNQIIKYIKFLYDSLNSYEHTIPELKLKPKRKDKLNILSQETMDQQKNSFKEVTRRMFNLLFLKDQLEEMVCDFLDKNIYERLDNSIFNLALLRKAQSQQPEYRGILGNIREIVEGVLKYEEKIVRRIAYITVLHYFKGIFENVYYQEGKSALEEFFSSNPDQLSDVTFLKMQDVLEEWMAIMSKNIPDDFITPYSIFFCQSFFQALRLQILNPYKFKVNIQTQKIIPYLQKDISLVIKMLKQRFFEGEVVDEKIKRPFQRILSDLQSETPKLTGMFENATLKNDEEQRKYILSVLYLRTKDEKAQDFVKSYRPKEPKTKIMN